jgi:hypothetical protein
MEGGGWGLNRRKKNKRKEREMEGGGGGVEQKKNKRRKARVKEEKNTRISLATKRTSGKRNTHNQDPTAHINKPTFQKPKRTGYHIFIINHRQETSASQQ